MEGITPWLLRILELSLVMSVMGPCVRFIWWGYEQQPITFSMNEEITYNLTRQVWLTLAKIVGDFFRMALEGRLG